MAIYTVANENIAAVWTASPHLTPFLVRLRGSNRAPIHLKNRIVTIPRTYRSNVHEEYRKLCRKRVELTVEYRTDENASGICFLLKVQQVWDLGSVGINGPGLL